MRALVSVSDKTDLELLGTGLNELGIEIYSTGGTKHALEAAGIPVRPVSDLTGFPEILGGRVKTLHPAVHGGLLARRDLPADMEALARHNLGAIDIVAVNLYPFEHAVAPPQKTGVHQPTALRAAALEQIDIGGPTMLRAAAKNYPFVLALCDPTDYTAALEALQLPDGPDPAFRRRLAAKVFRHTSVYDSLIAAYLGEGDEAWHSEVSLGLRKVQELRYGENPQQRAAFYQMVRAGSQVTGFATAQQHQGKPLSYNNLLDADAAWTTASDFEPITVAIIKHTNPCGLARAKDLETAYELALAGDPLAAFGGIIAANAPVDGALAQRFVERFYEIVLAPEFSPEALEVLARRPNLRVLALPPTPASGLRWRSIQGGMLVQEADQMTRAETRQARVVTQRAPSGQEWAALGFAWRAVRHVKSNAIVLARAEPGQEEPHLALVGMGPGQPSRVAAVEIAIQRAGSRATGSVLASDAFFPKPDGIEAAAEAGVRAIIQPGGSQGDRETIAAADAAGLAMVFTGTRHFVH